MSDDKRNNEEQRGLGIPESIPGNDPKDMEANMSDDETASRKKAFRTAVLKALAWALFLCALYALFDDGESYGSGITGVVIGIIFIIMLQTGRVANSIGKATTFILAFLGCTGLLAAGLFCIYTSSFHREFYYWTWAVFMLGVFFYVCGSLFYSKIVKWISFGLLFAYIVSVCGFHAWNWWTVGRFPVVKDRIDSFPYVKWDLAKVRIPPEYAMDPAGGYPYLIGLSELYPVYAAVARGMSPVYLKNWKKNTPDRPVQTSPDNIFIYEFLAYDMAQLGFASSSPASVRLAAAERKGVEYEGTPFCMDAFVFYVHADNPVDNLTTEQIRGIYSGVITDWKEVGAPESRMIVAYQRRKNLIPRSFDQLMGGTPLMEPPKTPYWEGFARLGYEPAAYRNSKGAIGYSYRFYATELLRDKKIKLLSIDGVAPTDENIRSGAYPWGKTMYMVTGRKPGSDDPRRGNVQKFMDYILSPEGQKLVEDTGYVPLGKTAENH